MGLSHWNQADVTGLATINSADPADIAWNGVGFDVVVPDYSAVISADSPVTYWKLDETSGTDAIDSSPEEYDGLYIAGFTLDQTPIIRSSSACVYLNGTTGRVVDGGVTPNVPTGSEALTLEVWCRLTFTPVGSDCSPIYLGSTAPTEIGLHMLANANIRLFGGGGVYHDTVDNEIGINETHYLVVTWNGTDSLQLWIDANKIYEGETKANHTATYFEAGGIRGTNTLPWEGYLSDAAVYDYALTPQQITDHYNSGLIS